MTNNITWSYSSIKTFDQCPKKYYHLRIAKDVKDSGSEATMYGQELHKAAEDYIKADTPIPPKFKFVTPVVDSVKNIPGDKHCELKLGVKKTPTGYEPCGFYDKDVWWRGISDVVVMQGDMAYSLDYKTSKNAKYADTKQLDLLAGAVFTHYPKIMEIKSALLFVVSNEMVKKKHEFMMQMSYLNSMEPELTRLEAAIKTNVWNPNSGPLCKFCPVTSCAHNRKG